MSDSEQLLQLDMKQVRKIMDEYYERDTVTYHDNKRQRDITVLRPSLNGDNALFDPELNPETHIKSIIAKRNQEYPESLRLNITSARKSISDTNNQISDINKKIQDKQSEKQKYTETAQHLVPQIKEKTNQLLAMFPERLHDLVMDYFTEYDYLLNKLRQNMNFFTKTFSAKSREQKFNQLYTEIADMLKQINLTTINDIEGATQRKQQSIDQDITRLNSNLATLNTKLHSTQSQMAAYQKQHDKLSNTLQEHIAQFLYTYDNRKHLRKRIPATLNMQGLSEPVSFFQTINNISAHDLKKLLEHAGLKTGYAPNEYIIRETQNIYHQPVVELITPFYSPDKARTNIETLLKYLAEHNVKFGGVTKPATYSQINPTPENHKSNKEHVSQLIRNKLYSPKSISTELFCIQQSDSNHLFRGQTFATSDPASSYATPTWRTGRSGIVYATPNPRYAISYATNVADSPGPNGGTMNPEYLFKLGNNTVGVVTVFKNSKRNLELSDRVLEEYGDRTDKQHNLKDNAANTKKSTIEMIVSPHNNPIVARYLVVRDRMVPIDENDPQWHEILDFMAPDMKRTHIHGLPATAKYFYTEGTQFIKRLNALEQDKKQNGHVTTYDISPEILAKMGYRTPRQQFSHATNTMRNHTPPVLIADNTKE
ncbi:MAG: hypothetical protein E7006_02985 [Alphaproteobacteria bacterium]|nr:hypothetical protein [Alphaproteobacteria bacterium]